MDKYLSVFFWILLIALYSTHSIAEKPVQPNQPLKGSINNIQISNFKAKWDNGILTLYTGKDPSFEYGTQLVIFNFLKTPANQELNIDARKKLTSVSIHVKSKDHKNIRDVIQSAFTIQLTSGQETDFRIPASIHLQATGKTRINIKGHFILATSDLVSHQGIIDRSQDNLATIQYIAKDFVRNSFPKKNIHFEAAGLSWFSNATQPTKNGKDKIQVGAYSAIFRVNNGKKQIKKMQLAKRSGKWTVVNTLKENQIHVAHKLTSPRYNRPPDNFVKIAAQHFEKNYYSKEGGWQKIKEPSYISCGGAQVGKQQGYCEVAYGIYYKGKFKINGSYQQTKCTMKTYLFIKKGNNWEIEKILPATKKFKSRTNEIVERTGDIWGC